MISLYTRYSARQSGSQCRLRHASKCDDVADWRPTCKVTTFNKKGHFILVRTEMLPSCASIFGKSRECVTVFDPTKSQPWYRTVQSFCWWLLHHYKRCCMSTIGEYRTVLKLNLISLVLLYRTNMSRINGFILCYWRTVHERSVLSAGRGKKWP